MGGLSLGHLPCGQLMGGAEVNSRLKRMEIYTCKGYSMHLDNATCSREVTP